MSTAYSTTPDSAAAVQLDDVMPAGVPALVCPTCGQAVRPDSAGDLRCSNAHIWRVRDQIPRFVASDHTYADAFGTQWLKFRRTQLDSYTGTTMSRDRARRCLGPELLAEIQRRDVRLLEVGCGAGRFTEVLLGDNAVVTSVDLSAAVEANQANFPLSARHRIVQADVNALPFAPGGFDVVFCLGVVQHTPNPEQTIAALYAHVRPGGWLVIDHYPAAIGWYLSLKPLYRAVLKRLPAGHGMRWTNRLVNFFLPLHSRLRGSRVGRSLLARVSPVSSYYGVFPLSEEHQREWALLDTHDGLTDWYKHRRTGVQLQACARALGAVAIWCAPGGNGFELRCRRPVA